VHAAKGLIISSYWSDEASVTRLVGKQSSSTFSKHDCGTAQACDAMQCNMTHRRAEDADMMQTNRCTRHVHHRLLQRFTAFAETSRLRMRACRVRGAVSLDMPSIRRCNGDIGS
jgi:hypothetical protein